MPTVNAPVALYPLRGLGGELRIGCQVRHLCRNRIERHPEPVRHARDRRLEVVRRERLAPRNDRGDARAGAHEALDRRLAFHDHARPACGEHRREPDELQRVAEALLGAQQERPPCDRSAVPSWRRRPRDRVAGHPQPPLVLRPPAGEIAVEQPQLRTVRMRLREIRSEGDRAVEMRRGRCELAARLEREPDAVVRERMVRADRERPTVRGERLVDPSDRRQREAGVGVGLRPVGLQAQGARVAHDRVVEATQLAERVAAVVMRDGVIRIDRKRGRIGVDRALECAGLREGDAVVREAFGVGRSEPQRGLVGCRRLAPLADPQQHAPERRPRARIARGGAHRRAQARRRLAEPAGALERDRLLERRHGTNLASNARRSPLGRPGGLIGPAGAPRSPCGPDRRAPSRRCGSPRRQAGPSPR